MKPENHPCTSAYKNVPLNTEAKVIAGALCRRYIKFFFFFAGHYRQVLIFYLDRPSTLVPVHLLPGKQAVSDRVGFKSANDGEGKKVTC